ncbi:MAG: FG-GAP-like repeat-containing protein [Caulobacteraceae bacterium]
MTDLSTKVHLPGLVGLQYDDVAGVVVFTAASGQFGVWNPDTGLIDAFSLAHYPSAPVVTADGQYALLMENQTQIDRFDLTTLSGVQSADYYSIFGSGALTLVTTQSGVVLSAPQVVSTTGGQAPAAATFFGETNALGNLGGVAQLPAEAAGDPGWLVTMVGSDQKRYVLIKAVENLNPATDPNTGVVTYYTSNRPGALYLYDSAAGQVTATNLAAFPEEFATTSQYSGGDDVSEAAGLIAVQTGGHADIFNFGLNQVATVTFPGREIHALHFNAGGHQLFAFDALNNDLVAYDTQTWSQVGVIHIGSSIETQLVHGNFTGIIGQMTGSADGRLLFLTDLWIPPGYVGNASDIGAAVALDLSARLQLTVTGDPTHSQVWGSVGSDTLIAGGGSHTLHGGGGADTFIFAPGMTASQVADFSQAEHDRVDLSAFGAFHTFADILDSASQVGADTVIALPGGVSLTMAGVQKAALTAVDFALPVAMDLNGDGVADTVWRSPTTGDWGVAAMDGSGGFSWHDIGITSTAYSIDGKGDFNGDGVADLVFRDHTSGDWGVAALTASGNLSWRDVGITSTTYAIDGSGDFNGDGVTDVIFRNHASGDWGFASMTPSGGGAWHGVGVTSTAYSIDGTGDFNGDGVADVIFRNHATGDWGYAALTRSGGSSWHDIGITATGYTIDGTGDFNGDGVADVIFRDHATGDWGYAALHPDGSMTWRAQGASSAAYAIVSTGDYTGDGLADVAWRNNATGDWGYTAMNKQGGYDWHDIGVSSTAYLIA